MKHLKNDMGSRTAIGRAPTGRRRGRIGLSVLSVAALMLAACGSDSGQESTNEDESSDSASIDADVTLGAGVTGGSYFVLGGAMGTLLEREIPGLGVSVLGGSNEGFIRQGTDCMFQQADTAAIAWSGTGGGAFEEGQAFSDLRLTGVGYANSAFLLSNEGTDLASSADLGPDVTLGVTSAQYEELLTEFLGSDQSSLPSFRVISGFDNLMTALIQGNVDAIQVVGAHPLPAVLESSNVRDFAMVPWDQGQLNTFIENYPYYPRATIPADAYNFIDQDMETWSRILVFLCHTSVSADVVHEMTKVTYENNDELVTALPQADEINLEVLQATLDADAIQLPIHEGAVRYFEEAGIELPASIPED